MAAALKCHFFFSFFYVVVKKEEEAREIQKSTFG
jgi:hypothetical protein